MSYLSINDDKTIRYEILTGDTGKPYLVFLHEGLGCVEMWKDFPERLCRLTGCSGLLYDRCGYGKSSSETATRDKRYLHDFARDELPQVITSVIPGKDHIVVGHSDGASIGLIYGADAPPLLKGLIVEAAHVFVEPETLKGIHIADTVYSQKGFPGLCFTL